MSKRYTFFMFMFFLLSLSFNKACGAEHGGIGETEAPQASLHYLFRVRSQVAAARSPRRARARIAQ